MAISTETVRFHNIDLIIKDLGYKQIENTNVFEKNGKFILSPSVSGGVHESYWIDIRKVNLDRIGKPDYVLLIRIHPDLFCICSYEKIQKYLSEELMENRPHDGVVWGLKLDVEKLKKRVIIKGKKDESVSDKFDLLVKEDVIKYFNSTEILKMKNYKIIGIAASLFLIVIVFFSYQIFEMKKENAILRDMSQQRKVDGKGESIDPYISGPVKNRILKGYSEIGKCYSEYIEKKPQKKEGVLKIDWQIDTGGKALSPEIILSDFNNPEFEKCVTSKIAKWVFPEPLVKKYVTHQFNFFDKKPN